jgi:hypothetical protein
MCEFYNVSRQGYYEYVKRQQEGNPDQALINIAQKGVSPMQRYL